MTMTIEEVTHQYQAVSAELRRMGAIGGYIADQSVHIYGDDNWSAIPGEEKSKYVFYSDGSSAEELRKKYNGVTFYTLINKKAAPQEADNKNTTTTVPEIAAACNGREECFEKCVAKDDFACCLKCESLSECPTNCREEM